LATALTNEISSFLYIN